MGYVVSLMLAERPVVVVGAGTVALRKVAGLLAARARVSVIAPSPCAEIERLAQEGTIHCEKRAYRPGDLAGAHLVIAATGDEDVNAQVAGEARGLGIPVNVVDRPALCTFTLPAVARRGDLTLAVSTEGRCPALARALREELESRFGEEYADLLDFMGMLRDEMMERGWASARIQGSLSALYARGLLGILSGRDRETTEAFVKAELGEDFPVPHTPPRQQGLPGEAGP